jgi:hypothetical protein
MRLTEEGFTAEMRVERVEEPAVFGFTWGIFGLPAMIRAVPMSSSRSSPSVRARG